MLESILLQIAPATSNITTTTTPALSESLTGLVNAVSLLVGAVIPLIVSVLSYVKARSHDPKIDNALDTAISVGKLTTATANKALENKESIKAAIELGLTVTPEQAQKTLAEKQALVEKLNKEIAATTAQIKQLRPLIPGNADADTITNLPREKDF